MSSPGSILPPASWAKEGSQDYRNLKVWVTQNWTSSKSVSAAMYLLVNDIEQDVDDASQTNAAFPSQKPLI